MGYRAVIDEIASELNRFTGSGAWFENFEVIKNPPIRQALNPPSIIIIKMPAPGPEYGLGQTETRILNIHIDLVFKDGFLKTVGSDVLQRDDLAAHYLERLQSFFSLIRLTSSDSFQGAVFQGGIHKEPGQLRSPMLYGVQAEAFIRFAGG